MEAVERVRVAPTMDRVSDRRVAELRRLVEHTAKPCGCKSGAAMVIVGLIGWPIWKIVSGAPTSAVPIAGAVLVWAGLVVSGAVVGKLAGIAVGRWRHKRLRQRLHRALRSAEDQV